MSDTIPAQASNAFDVLFHIGKAKAAKNDAETMAKLADLYPAEAVKSAIDHFNKSAEWHAGKAKQYAAL